ncbi:unnamed protein product [Arabidopsis halleri]
MRRHSNLRFLLGYSTSGEGMVMEACSLRIVKGSLHH